MDGVLLSDAGIFCTLGFKFSVDAAAFSPPLCTSERRASLRLMAPKTVSSFGALSICGIVLPENACAFPCVRISAETQYTAPVCEMLFWCE